MDENTLDALFQWFSVFQKIVLAPSAVFTDIKRVLAAHGIEADTAALDAVIADASRRKAIAQREAAGVTDIAGTIVTGD
jgi:hypothetical protein